MDRHSFKASAKTTLDLYNYLENRINEGRLNLSPDYQREFVWTDTDREAYLESLYIGFAPSILIFNKESDNTLVCIDGKQRIDTIRQFYNNEIAFLIDDEYVYYKETDGKTKDGVHDARVMTDDEITEFQDIVLYNHEYNKLTYDEQVDLFNRIQQGKKLSAGEIIKSSLSKEVNNRIQRIMDRYSVSLEKYVVKKRQNMYYFFVKFIYMLGTDNLSLQRTQICESYPRSKDDNDSFDLDKACKKANTFFKNHMNVLDNSKLNKRYEHLFLILCYRLCNYYRANKDLNDDDVIAIINKYRETAIEYHKDEKLKITQSSNKTLQMFSDIFDEVSAKEEEEEEEEEPAKKVKKVNKTKAKVDAK